MMYLKGRKLSIDIGVFRFGWNRIEKFRFGLYQANCKHFKMLLSKQLELHFCVRITLDFDW